MTANEVWAFTTTDGKVTLAGRADLKDHAASDVINVIEYESHSLVVRVADGFAEKCRTCDAVGLVKGQMCSFINEYNDKVNPL